MEDIERLSKDANLAYYEMVNSNKREPLTKVSGNYKLFTKELDQVHLACRTQFGDL